MDNYLKVKNYLKQFNLDDRTIQFDESSATVELAAKCLNVNPNRIAKSMAFNVNDQSIIVVTAGDTKVNNQAFKDFFHCKATFISPDLLIEKIGHPMGGVCPFALNDNVTVYIDESVKRFDYIYPAAGTPNSAVKLSVDELFLASNAIQYVNVFKINE